MEASLSLLSIDFEPSTPDNPLLLVIDSQTILENRKVAKLRYRSKTVEKIFTDGKIEEYNYVYYDSPEEIAFTKAVLFEDLFVVMGYGDKTLHVYLAKHAKFYEKITIENNYTHFYADKSQLYVHIKNLKTNIYNTTFDLVHTSAFGTHDILAVQQSYDIYCVIDDSGNLCFKNATNYFINGRTISEFNYKNEKIELSGRKYALFRFANKSTSCYVVVTRGNIYVINSTLCTVIWHETFPDENNIYNVVYVEDNRFNVYWSTQGNFVSTHQYVSHYKVEMNNIIPYEPIELTTELKNQTLIDSSIGIFHISKNIPDTQIVHRICFSGFIYEKFTDGFSAQRLALLIDGSDVRLPEDYKVCVLNDKIFFGFNNVIYMFDIKTLRFIQKFMNVVHWNGDNTHIYFHMKNKVINCYKLNDGNIVLDEHFDGFKINTLYAIKDFRNDDCIYAVTPEEGILMKKNRLTHRITTLKYKNGEITLGHLSNLFQITDDENNKYYLAISDNTIYVIDPTFERVQYIQTFDFAVQQITHVRDNCFNVYRTLKQTDSYDRTCILHYKLKMINNDQIETVSIGA